MCVCAGKLDCCCYYYYYYYRVIMQRSCCVRLKGLIVYTQCVFLLYVRVITVRNAYNNMPSVCGSVTVYSMNMRKV